MGRQLRLNPISCVKVISPAAVRSRIARLMLGEPASDSRLGSITLHSHQMSAVERLQTAIDQFNGALLCDDVGMGKTYVAIAIARRFSRRLVVAPAALASMWQNALAATGIDAAFVTFEALSRADARARHDKVESGAGFDLVIIDEAHHVRNARTNRYFALESLARGARVLLLSATPIHNRRQDLAALLSLFLGSRAHSLTSAELALCVVRREQKQLEKGLRIPTVLPTEYHELPDDPALVEQLMDLPPPVPVRDGGVATALIGRSFVHQLSSSEAALTEALKRRIARAAALCASLEAGTYPTARELETWIYGEGALQLGFAELLSAPIAEHEELLASVRVHLDALERIRVQSSAASTTDAARAQIISAVRNLNTGGRIVAFAQYAETISMLFRRLVRSGKVAMLTSHGARVAGGSLTRSEAIGRFAPRATGKHEPSAADAIDLLFTTDLLSEGVNLQDANMVVHLDIPWTVARMEQRVGRVARLGSLHAEVIVHALRPPRSADQVLHSESIVERKWRLAKESVGTSASRPMPEPFANTGASDSDSDTESTPGKTERLRAILGNWITDHTDRCSKAETSSQTIVVATAEAIESGFVAAVSMHDAPQLLVGSSDRVSTDVDSQIDVCANAGLVEAPTDQHQIERTFEMISDWFTAQLALAAAGLGASAALNRKEITRRIDACIDSAPPHLRTSRLAIAAQARTVATTPQGSAIEQDLGALLESELPPEEWLRTIASLQTKAGRSNTASTDPPRIHAILLLRRT